MIVHFSALRRFQYNRAWAPVMNIIAKEFRNRGYTIQRDSALLWWREPDNVHVGNNDNADVIIYTDKTQDNNLPGLYVGLQGPEPGYFSIDRVGVWPHLEQTYTIPEDLSVMEANFHFSEAVGLWKDAKISHYNNSKLNLGINSPPVEVPDNHVLLIWTAMENEWSPGWNRQRVIFKKLLEADLPVVVKYDPQFMLKSDGTIDPNKMDRHKEWIDYVEGDAVVLTGLESLHDILPKSRCVVMDEHVINLEPFMYNKPILCTGNPPYRHYAKQIHHAHQLIPAIKDLSWFHTDRQWSDTQTPTTYDWFQWYVSKYLCNDVESVSRRLDELLEPITQHH